MRSVSWLREIRQEVQLSKEETETFKRYYLLRGKILNVEKAMQHKVFENEEIRNIYTALGVTIGTEDDSKALNLE